MRPERTLETVPSQASPPSLAGRISFGTQPGTQSLANFHGRFATASLLKNVLPTINVEEPCLIVYCLAAGTGNRSGNFLRGSKCRGRRPLALVAVCKDRRADDWRVIPMTDFDHEEEDEDDEERKLVKRQRAAALQKLADKPPAGHPMRAANRKLITESACFGSRKPHVRICFLA